MAVNTEAVFEIQKEIAPAELVAATKYATVEDLKQLSECGVKIFGENRVQAFLEKYEAFNGNVQWHMIGTLQCNKVKYIIDKVSMIHSVVSLSLVDEIQKQAAKHALNMPVLLQVNIAEEESKHGFGEEEVSNALLHIRTSCPNVIPSGFMMMAPKADNPESVRVYFRRLRQLAAELRPQFPEWQLTTLSMGMSNDYKIAVEEGSTMVRVGRRLFS